MAQHLDYAAEQKIFLGGLSHNLRTRLSEDEIRKHFVEYGNVLLVEIMESRDARKLNCAVVTFEDTASVNQVLQQVSC